ncbi:ganglioside-induced differentiation-associated protein 2 [Cinnamomum micranthum f. kanehirae]|uniref:Ganglioside-induced differentiation-associated protein 2 n=1 Tax=Cinnamomum micranthum f. kanehirae TaxID=337451 RepID=A0A443NN07_9MAGN|nr:ganglioside-induced differentiation-associated protein 2 [Cinnamomum micranthum f. kanehirae]
MGRSSADDFSVHVLASDLGVDARSLLSAADGEAQQQQQPPQGEVWHDCSSEDFSDLDLLQAFRVEGSDKSGNRIFRIVGKFFPAPVVSAERLKKYIFHKMFTELSQGPFCIVYIHSTVQKEDNSPGVSILRWIYEELPPDFKDRLHVIVLHSPWDPVEAAFCHPGRFFLSGGLYWKIKYVSRLQYLWDDIKKDQIEIPDFVQSHDDVLEHRPLTDYGIEPDPLHLTEVPAMSYSMGRYEERWASQSYS